MTILVVDDDRVLADLVSFTLRRERYEVICAHDGDTALQRCRQEMPNLVVLDVNLPDTDGFTLCTSIRTESNIPVILLTVRNHEDDILRGFEAGADDYVAKPFSPRQLVARARAVLRRAGGPVQPEVRNFGDWRLDPVRRELHNAEGEVVMLSLLESQLLDYFVINAGLVLSFDAIIDHLWGPEGGTRSMVRQLVYRLRGKLEDAPQHYVYVHTLAGIGYEFKPMCLA